MCVVTPVEVVVVAALELDTTSEVVVAVVDDEVAVSELVSVLPRVAKASDASTGASNRCVNSMVNWRWMLAVFASAIGDR